MYTVRHVGLRGDESLHECKSVTVGKHDVTGHKTVFTHNDDVTGSIDSGSVYVMNEHGKTVAIYDLGDPRNAQSSDAREANLRTIREAGSQTHA